MEQRKREETEQQVEDARQRCEQLMKQFDHYEQPRPGSWRRHLGACRRRDTSEESMWHSEMEFPMRKEDSGISRQSTRCTTGVPSLADVCGLGKREEQSPARQPQTLGDAFERFSGDAAKAQLVVETLRAQRSLVEAQTEELRMRTSWCNVAAGDLSAFRGHLPRDQGHLQAEFRQLISDLREAREQQALERSRQRQLANSLMGFEACAMAVEVQLRCLARGAAVFPTEHLLSSVAFELVAVETLVAEEHWNLCEALGKMRDREAMGTPSTGSKCTTHCTSSSIGSEGSVELTYSPRPPRTQGPHSCPDTPELPRGPGPLAQGIACVSSWSRCSLRRHGQRVASSGMRAAGHAPPWRSIGCAMHRES